ncbi:MAG: hypothetical protein KGR18_00915 [Acidobacteria bacterium]|nr:hypothetical protein [Acidobacteriota bacterium]
MSDPDAPASRAAHSEPHPLEKLLDTLPAVSPEDPPELLILRDPERHGCEPCSPEPHSGGADPGASPIDHHLDIRVLLGSDPVSELIGLRAAPSWHAVGLRAGATGRVTHGSEASPCGLIHVIARDGTSITHLTLPDRSTIRLGPDRTIREGRVPDLCRRILALPTEPPPPDMAAFVLDAWLAIIARAALLTPGLGWGEVLALGPFMHLDPTERLHEGTTPAAVASALCATARSLDWHRYREVCIATAGCPVSGLSPTAVAWMDTGMFARWTIDSLPAVDELLALLEPTLAPSAFDRLWAAISLARPHDPPPDHPPQRHP